MAWAASAGPIRAVLIATSGAASRGVESHTARRSAASVLPRPASRSAAVSRGHHRSTTTHVVLGVASVSACEKGVRLFRQDTTKGKKPRGHLVPAFAVAMIERRLGEVPRTDLDLVFPTARGGLREVSTVEAQWRRFRERNPEWSWITPHTFRKSVGTAITRGADIDAAAAQLGHSSSSITARHYVETVAVGPDHREILEQFAG